VAVKQITLSPEAMERERQEHSIQTEMRIWHMACHNCQIKGIANFYGFYKTESTFNLVSAYHPGNTVEQWLDADIDSAAKLEILVQVADTLVQLHGAGIYHLDVAARNVLLNRDPTVAKGHRIGTFLCDFGLASTQEIWKKLEHIPKEAPPECYSGARSAAEGIQNEKVDVWMFGIMALQILLSGIRWKTRRSQLFSSDNRCDVAMIREILESGRMDNDSGVRGVQQLLAACLISEPQHRTTMKHAQSQLLQMWASAKAVVPNVTTGASSSRDHSSQTQTTTAFSISGL
jgi:serine/threonine protein kinase